MSEGGRGEGEEDEEGGGRTIPLSKQPHTADYELRNQECVSRVVISHMSDKYNRLKKTEANGRETFQTLTLLGEKVRFVYYNSLEPKMKSAFARYMFYK